LIYKKIEYPMSKMEFPMSKECIAIALPFYLKIDRIPSFINGHSIWDIHYSLFMPYAFPDSAREREKFLSFDQTSLFRDQRRG